ncbi:MAG: ATP synthase F1 subunit delta [Balneolaceae bacterium]|nr:MAG: ATP synthase F1 subunit delta [Balneolaceae bacterium]
MSASQAIRRYAKAMLDSASETGQQETRFKDFQLIGNTLNSSPDLGLFLKSPVIRQAQKKAVLRDIFKGKVDSATMQFLSLLSDKKREALLNGIATSYMKQYKDFLGIIEIRVVSSDPLSSDQIKQLEKELIKLTDSKVELSTEIDESLIGGILIQIEDTVIDGSVKQKLSRLKEKYTSAVFE